MPYLHDSLTKLTVRTKTSSEVASVIYAYKEAIPIGQIPMVNYNDDRKFKMISSGLIKSVEKW